MTTNAFSPYAPQSITMFTVHGEDGANAFPVAPGQKVTLIGRTTGGGSCSVQPMTTAYGTVFQVSSAMQMSFLKNGSFYDIDQGVEPDYYINNIANYYDREALTNFINNLF